MRVSIVCAGSRGDVVPYVALGAGLARAGHGVALVTHEEFRPLVEARGFELRPLAGNPRELMERARARAVLSSGRNVFSFLRNLTALWHELQGPFLLDCERGCGDAEAVVFSTLAFPAWHVAQARGVPAIGGFLQPQTRTSAFAAPGFPVPRMLRSVGAYNRATYHLLEMQAWLLVRHAINRWRRERLGLPPLGGSGPFPHIYRGEVPILYGFSPALVPPPPDWPPSIRTTGTWFLDGAGPPPSPELEAFLDDGPPPVYVGFGSMRGASPERTAAIIVEALQRVGARGILGLGWGGMRPRELPPEIFVVEEVAHDRLFPRVAAVVHHGGAGTTAAGLRAGRPTVIVPFLGDQYFWGERVRRLHAGPAPVPHWRLSVGRLAAAISRALEEPALRIGAREIGARLRSEDGVGAAVREIERVVERGGAASRQST